MGAHDLHEVQKLLANLDCGLCGAPSCATLARRIVAGRQEPEDCAGITKANLSRLKKMIEEGIEVSKHVDHSDLVVEIQPCAEYGRVTLEAQLPKPEGSIYDLFDSCQMCTSFSDISSLNGVKCSLELGYGLAELQEKRIHVFRSGKVTMRRAFDREDAYKTLALISRSLWPAVICSCGCSVLECMGCMGEECRDKICAGIEWGLKRSKYEIKPLYEVLDKCGDKRMDEILEDLDNVVATFRKVDQINREGEYTKTEKYRESLHKELRDVTTLGTKMIVEAEMKDAICGLAMQSLEMSLRSIGEALLSVRENAKQDLYNASADLAFESYRAFRNKDVQEAKEIIKESGELREKWVSAKNKYSLHILKLITYSSFIACMISRPTPLVTEGNEMIEIPGQK
jgi:ArsR family metal-binding transcriptional regulator